MDDPLKLLWLTLCDLDPATNGQFLYSGGLIRGVARAGAHLTVLGLARDGLSALRKRERGIDWMLFERSQTSAWRRALSPYPAVALCSCTPASEAALAAFLGAQSWDGIVLDSICAAWALPAAKRYQRQSPGTALVYLAHNDETAVARYSAATGYGPRRIRKLPD
jgi:hypothetical protein